MRECLFVLLSTLVFLEVGKQLQATKAKFELEKDRKRNEKRENKQFFFNTEEVVRNGTVLRDSLLVVSMPILNTAILPDRCDILPDNCYGAEYHLQRLTVVDAREGTHARALPKERLSGLTNCITYSFILLLILSLPQTLTHSLTHPNPPTLTYVYTHTCTHTFSLCRRRNYIALLLLVVFLLSE